MQASYDVLQRRAKDCHDGPAGGAAEDEAGLPSEPAPQDPGEDPRPNEGVAEPARAGSGDPCPTLAGSKDPCATVKAPRPTVSACATEPVSGPQAAPQPKSEAERGQRRPKPSVATNGDMRRTLALAPLLPGSLSPLLPDSRPAVATAAQAATAAPAPTVSTPGLGTMPYPPIPLLNDKPPTPEVHLAYRQWQDHQWQSSMLRPLYGSASLSPPLA
jgi:hypothetical protein